MEIKKVELLGTSPAKNLSIGSGCVITRDGQILLVRSKGDDKYKFPGGHIDDSENFKESATREVAEEIGCEIEITGEPVFYLFEPSETLDIILIHYPARLLSGEPVAMNEVEEVAWFDLSSLPENLFGNVRAVVARMGLV